MKLVHLLQRPRHPLYKARNRNGQRGMEKLKEKLNSQKQQSKPQSSRLSKRLLPTSVEWVHLRSFHRWRDRWIV
jgi:hypothetical protein